MVEIIIEKSSLKDQQSVSLGQAGVLLAWDQEQTLTIVHEEQARSTVKVMPPADLLRNHQAP